MKRSFPQRRPMLFVVLLLLVVLATFVFSGVMTVQFKLSALTMTLMGDGVLACIALFLLTRLHWWREVGFRLLSKPHYLWFFTIPCLPFILNIAFFGVSYPGIERLLLFLVLALLVGFVEETYFRGMILRALLFRGPWQAVLISSLLFGLMHLLLTDFFGYLELNSTIVTNGLSTLVFIVTAGEIIVYTAYSIILMRQMKPRAFGAIMETTSMPSLAHEELV
jgi:membrane protease YdiL (CAAX protease family)